MKNKDFKYVKISNCFKIGIIFNSIIIIPKWDQKIFASYSIEIAKVNDKWKFYFNNWDTDIIMKCDWDENFIVLLYCYGT